MTRFASGELNSFVEWRSLVLILHNTVIVVQVNLDFLLIKRNI